ncbi:MAG: 23S rRNA (uracil(1939)-C(5))-methyltransferase RlmD [SAR202 cluster bacterium]|nr:23S rRNA (uracil(1939)-C(5))-methyltransferase RlmD [SAR202 cluster bacterium]|tara:strand:- start:8910 stop:10160 length:1251 start_codon:yes stop_codon:yes gene_type:complete
MAKHKRRRRYSGPDITGHVDLNPGDQFQTTLNGINDSGDTTSEIQGAPLEVSGGLPGEKVVVEVQKRFPERIVAKVIEVLEPAEERVVPECEYFLTCSGCQWQHASYDYQLHLKQARVQREIDKYESLSQAVVDPTIGSSAQLSYRNHGRFTVGKKDDRGKIGYVNAITRHFVKIDRCLLMNDQINKVLDLAQDNVAGQTQMAIRAGSNTDSMLIQPRMDLSHIGLVTGEQHYEEEVRGSRFRVAASSFFQVNTSQLSRAIDEARELLDLDGTEVMVDAYCGVGVFTVLLAPYVRKIIGVEESASAIQDAGLNSMNIPNIEFVEGKTEHILNALSEDIDVLLLDPPRVGCHPDVLDSVLKLKPEKVLMISCEPEAMARDLNLLCSAGTYNLETIRPVDMFPQTRHVETISMLRLQG